ncbi:P-loop containing nucleoside triphosphate hydrolase [Vibrio phage VP-1]|uniref:P-loop containing nucleoside triphosphate hydrolase n=1 Tax=Vibrio phage VP-1 TaxID=2234088 RepID=A0A4P2THB2_9CAUD|nr:P-loop containing nucleoside triphosphate hydrolase [Vibrio phage VP-1]
MILEQIESKYTLEEIKTVADRLFPFRTPDGGPSYNVGQEESIIQTVNAFLNKGRTHVVLEAPTGIGKTAIARTIYYTLRSLLNQRFRATIHTTTIGLQDQYVAEDSKVFSLKGKRNYQCTAPVASASCTYGSNECRQLCRDGDCNPKLSCPYILNRERWTKVEDLRVTNSSMMVTLPHILCTGENGSDLMVLDECHKMKNTLRDHCTMRFDYRSSGNHKRKGAPNSEVIHQTVHEVFQYCCDRYRKGDMVDIPNELREIIRELSQPLTEATNVMAGLMKKGVGGKYLITLNEAMEYYQNLASYVDIMTSTSADKFVVDDITDTAITFKPVFAKDVAEFALYSKADYFLHMSATICGTKKYVDDMGIPKDRVEILEIDNPIPLENRVIHYLPVGKINAKATPEIYQKLVDGIDEIIDSHEGQNGLIHTVSYKLAEMIKRQSKHGKRIWIGRDRKETMEALRRGAESGRGIIVASPSMEEGYDLKHDLGRFCIIAKVPYAYLGDPLIKYVCSKDPGSYQQEAVLRIVQACGRCVRGVDDFGTTYILDEGFGNLTRFGGEYMQNWFLDGVQMHD